MTSTAAPTQWEEWRRNWPFVLAAFLGNSVSSGVWVSIGLFIDPLVSEFGWSRTQITAGISLQTMVAIPLTPFVGAIIDRYGGRRVGIPGLTAMIIAISSLSLANGSTVQWLILWAIFGVAHASVQITIWMHAVMGRFVAGRSMAMAVVMAGMYFAGAVGPSFAEWLISSYGWRVAFLGFGLGWGIPALVLCLFFLRDTPPNAERAGTEEAKSTTQADLSGLTIREAFKSIPLYRIAGAALIIFTLGAGLLVHKAPILIEAGISRSDAAAMAGLSGIAGIAGKVISAWAMQRWNAGQVGGVTIGLMGVAMIFLLKPFATPVTILFAMMAIGFASGAKLQIAVYLTSIYVGKRNFGKIFGVISAVISLSAGLGPLLGGMAYDAVGNYSLLIYTGVPLCFVGWLLLVRLGEYPDWTGSKEVRQTDA